jgi:hypothetical protein
MHEYCPTAVLAEQAATTEQIHSATTNAHAHVQDHFNVIGYVFCGNFNMF